jgi:SAM-dependent MidA family methyltransferase
MNIELASLIRAKIENEGPITVKEFLNHVLTIQNEHFAPEPVIRKGVYRPSMFRKVISDWCLHFWEANDRPANLKIIVFAPKNGALVSEILEHKGNKEFIESIHIYIVEQNAYFLEVQKQNLKGFSTKITWLERFEQIPINAPTITIANKFLSSLPIDQYTRKKGEWLENVVDLSFNKQHFCITHLNKLNEELIQYLDAKYSHVQEGGIVELQDTASILLKKILGIIKEFGGSILLIDYGYVDHSARDFISTLQATHNMALSPIFYNLGNNLLSAQLNFSNIKETSELQGGRVHGPITQREFLLNMKLEDKKAQLLEQLPEQQHPELLTEFERLTSPEQLGHLFKAMSICNLSNAIAGFANG